MINFVPPFEYKGHSLYATLVRGGGSSGLLPEPDRWQGYMDNRPLHQWVATGKETEDDVRVILRTEAEAELRSRTG